MIRMSNRVVDRVRREERGSRILIWQREQGKEWSARNYTLQEANRFSFAEWGTPINQCLRRLYEEGRESQRRSTKER